MADQDQAQLTLTQYQRLLSEIQSLKEMLVPYVNDDYLIDRVVSDLLIAIASIHTAQQIKSRQRYETICDARNIVAYTLYNHYGMSLATVGKYLDGRDHTSVINMLRQYRSLYDSDNNFRQLADKASQFINS